MNTESLVSILEKRIISLGKTEGDLFLVDISVKPTNNIKIFVDADRGVDISRLSRLNRILYKEIEEGGFFPDGNFSLEVSSPGLDEPLKLYRQYVKNIGRNIEVVEKDGTKKEGRLISVNENEIIIEEEKGRSLPGRPAGKKKEIIQHTILFDNIKTTKIQIKF